MKRVLLGWWSDELFSKIRNWLRRAAQVYWIRQLQSKRSKGRKQMTLETQGHDCRYEYVENKTDLGHVGKCKCGKEEFIYNKQTLRAWKKSQEFVTSWGKDEPGENPTLRAMAHFDCKEDDLGCSIELNTGLCTYWLAGKSK